MSDPFALFETLRWEPQSGFLRGERHLARLKQSVNQLGFYWDPDSVLLAMDEAVGGATALRVRVELARDGSVSVTTAPYSPLRERMVWRLCVAQTRLDSGDELLRHKTTRRDVYAAARAEYDPAEADEVLLLNERAELCEGTITTVFVREMAGGPLLTPPLSCGLLPGVLRGELLESGKAAEAILTADDLERAAEIHCGNSLRGLIPAVMA